MGVGGGGAPRHPMAPPAWPHPAAPEGHPHGPGPPLAALGPVHLVPEAEDAVVWPAEVLEVPRPVRWLLRAEQAMSATPRGGGAEGGRG